MNEASWLWDHEICQGVGRGSWRLSFLCGMEIASARRKGVLSSVHGQWTMYQVTEWNDISREQVKLISLASWDVISPDNIWNFTWSHLRTEPKGHQVPIYLHACIYWTIKNIKLWGITLSWLKVGVAREKNTRVLDMYNATTTSKPIIKIMITSWMKLFLQPNRISAHRIACKSFSIVWKSIYPNKRYRHCSLPRLIRAMCPGTTPRRRLASHSLINWTPGP